MIVDGLHGRQLAPLNLAGVLPWIHWRGLLILALLVAGNFSCMACPFTLPRRLAGRWLGFGRVWPHWLRTKWLSLVFVALFLWGYETFALWDSPRWTAWIVVSYFVAAFAVDGFFRAGTFCKYVCPIGQFNFVQSLVSPLQVKVRAPDRCASCRTHECIRGSAVVPGCPTRLFQPHKSSNMDCTFCLDCVHSCPHDNVGLIAGLPGAELWRDPFRSGIGRFGTRTDLAALVVVLTFGALTNAAGMVGPVVDELDQLRTWLGDPPAWVTTTLFTLLGLVVLPATTVGLAAAFSRRWGQFSRKRARRGHPVCVRARADRFWRLALALQLSLFDELGDGAARHAAGTAGSRLHLRRRAAVPMRLLSAGGRLAREVGARVR